MTRSPGPLSLSQRRRTIEYRFIMGAATWELAFWVQLLTRFTARAAEHDSCQCQGTATCTFDTLFGDLEAGADPQTRAVAPELRRYFERLRAGWEADPTGVGMWPNQTLVNSVCNPLRTWTFPEEPWQTMDFGLLRPGFWPLQKYVLDVMMGLVVRK